MKIVFERTGGFAGFRLKAALDDASLPAGQARRLHQLLEESRFFELPLRIESAATGPDRFQYRLTVEKDNCVHTVQAGEDAVPRTMRPLLEWLTAFSRKHR